MSPQLDAIAYRAKDQPHGRFTALAPNLTVEFLEDTWRLLHDPRGVMRQHCAGGLGCDAG